MSEYQYFEFQAVDWSLGEKQIEELRKYSGRAAITSTSFVNEYHYGDFKGDSLKWMQKYFDGFVYFANWGTRELFLRFPKAAIESKLIEQYCSGEVFDLVETDSHSIVCFSVDEIDSDQLWESDEGTLSDFLKLRSAVLENEDYRVFYLGWLLSLQRGYVDEEDLEPPLPYGLKSLNEPLEKLVEFFGIDRDLIKIASQNSTEEPFSFRTDDIEPCVAGLGSGEKFTWLCRLAEENNKNLGAEFRRVILPDSGLELFCDCTPRKAGELLAELR